MNKQEFIEKIKSSHLSDDNKNKIIALLSDNELSFEIKEQVKDIIQDDINEASKGLLTEDDQTEIDAATEEMSQESAKLQKELEEDMQFVEKEMDNLVTMAGDLDKVADKIEIDKIKSSI